MHSPQKPTSCTLRRGAKWLFLDLCVTMPTIALQNGTERVSPLAKHKTVHPCCFYQRYTPFQVRNFRTCPLGFASGFPFVMADVLGIASVCR